MKILYVVTKFPNLSESFVMNEIYELCTRGHEVFVFSLTDSQETISHSEYRDIDIPIQYGEPPSYSSLPELFTEEVVSSKVLREALFWDNPIKHARWLHIGKQISKFVDEVGGVDVIHSHFAAPNRLSVVYAAAYQEVPCTVTAHAHEIFSPNDVGRLKRVCSRFNHIVVPSKYNQEYLMKKIGVETDMTVVPATTRVDKFEASEGCISGRLLSVGRLVEKKGYKYAIESVAELVNQNYEVEYHIVGTGEQGDYLREQVRHHGIEDYVSFLGHVSDETLQKELHEAELFILPCVIASNGDRDVAPVALKEAMATQTACISTSISAIPELITDGHDGILVDPNDTAALVDALASLLEDPNRRKEIAAKGRETVENKFDISQTVDKLVGVFQYCIRSHDGHRAKAIDTD